MIRTHKSNKIALILLLIMCGFLLFNPMVYAKACLNAISVWSLKVLPLLFPFFVLTKLILNLSTPKENFLDKFFFKAYHTPAGSASTFFLATLAGYPVGAKLICEMHKNGQVNSETAKKMLSFCSVSGPMFMLGTVGIGMLFSFKAGIIILISNILASLINGLLYRGKIVERKSIEPTLKLKKDTSLSTCVYDSLVSILMVGAFIAISFILIELLSQLHIFEFLGKTICGVLNMDSQLDVVLSILKGTIEITGGILSLSLTNCSLAVKIILASGLIGFGGVSVMMQSLSFLGELKIPMKVMLKQKLTQGLLCLIISALLILISF